MLPTDEGDLSANNGGRQRNLRPPRSLRPSHRRERGPEMEEKVRNAIIEELTRQAAEAPDLNLRVEDPGIIVHGPVDLDALVMVVLGAMAGGP